MFSHLGLQFSRVQEFELEVGWRHERQLLGSIVSLLDSIESVNSLTKLAKVLELADWAVNTEGGTEGSSHLSKVGELDVSPGQIAQEVLLVAKELGQLLELSSS